MDKINKCIDCNEPLRNMNPLAKRCKNCRRIFQDKSSYEKKKRDRAEISKKNTVRKLIKTGADKEIIEETNKKIIWDLEKLDSFGINPPRRYSLTSKSVGEAIDERVESKLKEKEAKIRNDILNEKLKRELAEMEK